MEEQRLAALEAKKLKDLKKKEKLAEKEWLRKKKEEEEAKWKEMTLKRAAEAAKWAIAEHQEMLWK